MTKQAVFCTTTSRAQAEAIVNRLKLEGFNSCDISALFPDKKDNMQFIQEKHTKAPEGATAGGSTGGIIGGALGWLVGIGSLAIPGVGPFIAAGPIMAALSGAAIGGAVGGVAGALIGLGIPEVEAKRYEGKLREGHVLISVHTDNNQQIETAKTVFKEAGAQDISCSKEIVTHAGTCA